MNHEFIPIPIGNEDIVSDMIKVDDGLIMAGSINEGTSTGNDFGLIKIDFDGNLMWKRTYHDKDDIAFSFIQTQDEGFLIVGRTKDGGVNNMLIIKTDKDGLINE